MAAYTVPLHKTGMARQVELEFISKHTAEVMTINLPMPNIYKIITNLIALLHDPRHQTHGFVLLSQF